MYALVVPEIEYQQRVAVAMKAAAYYRGMTAEDLADRVGVAVETVRRWMRADRGISAADAALVADALDAPSDLFIRPPESRERALAMMAAWDALREAGPPLDPSRP
jgi:transcriptional regulator with XRE-family HTH domain